MGVERKEKIGVERLLFMDFNGVLSYQPYWHLLLDEKHPLHDYYLGIREFVFHGKERLLNGWLLGQYSSEDIHHKVSEVFGISYEEIFSAFREGCKKLDVSTLILKALQPLRKNFHCILRTDNVDSFRRFTLPENPKLVSSFDEIHCSCDLGNLKKTNGGAYFRDVVSEKRMEIENCVLIDDSERVCRVFRDLGGIVFQPNREDEVVKTLLELNNQL